MALDPRAILAKFGDAYVADEKTYKMGIDRRFSHRIAERFRGRRVLETCTGAGFTTIALAKAASHVVTIDIDAAHQRQARMNVETAGLLNAVTFVLGNALDPEILEQASPYDAAFLDPDWAVTGPNHVVGFRGSNTRPPADDLLKEVLALTSDVALILPPFIDTREFAGIPAHERQSLYLGDKHELYCIYFGGLARVHGPTELRL